VSDRTRLNYDFTRSQLTNYNRLPRLDHERNQPFEPPTGSNYLYSLKCPDIGTSTKRKVHSSTIVTPERTDFTGYHFHFRRCNFIKTPIPPLHTATAAATPVPSPPNSFLEERAGTIYFLYWIRSLLPPPRSFPRPLRPLPQHPRP
jgi:hypothetical protein